MKEFFTKLIKVLSNILLVVSVAGLVASVVLWALNGAVEQGMIESLADNPFFKWLTVDKIGTATVYLGSIVAAGGIAKVASGSLKLALANSKTELEKQAQVYEAKIEQIKSESIEVIVTLTEQVNKLADAQKYALITNNQMLESMLITARRNIKSNLVSEEEKAMYKRFIRNVEKKVEPKLDNIYLSIEEVKEVTEQTKPIEEQRDILSIVMDKKKEE